MGMETQEAASETRSGDHMGEVQSTLAVNAEIVASLLPEFDQVSISVLDSAGSVLTCAQAGEVANDLDQLQYGLGEGPCIDSIRGGVRVVAPHIQRDDRWSGYVPSAAELGLRAQLAAPLGRRGEGPLGALNLYSTTRREIAATAPPIAEALAAQVAAVLESSREIENLHRALATRKAIGVAVGLLMAEYQLSETAALAALKRHSSEANVKVRDIAARIVAESNAALVMPTGHARASRHHRAPGKPARDRSRSLGRKGPASEAVDALAVDDDKWFQLTFVTPEGRTYEMTLQAPTDIEAVRRADEALEGVERVAIGDFLRGEGLTVRPPARLHVERAQAHQAVLGLGLVITDSNGTVTRKHLDR